MTFRLVAFALLGALALPASAGDSAEPERIIYFLGQYYRYTGSASDFPEIQERFARLEDASTRSTVREADWRVIQTQTQPLKGADVGNVQDFVRQAEESAQQGEKARSLLQRVRGGAAQLAGAARAAQAAATRAGQAALQYVRGGIQGISSVAGGAHMVRMAGGTLVLVVGQLALLHLDAVNPENEFRQPSVHEGRGPFDAGLRGGGNTTEWSERRALKMSGPSVEKGGKPSASPGGESVEPPPAKPEDSGNQPGKLSAATSVESGDAGSSAPDEEASAHH